MNTIRRFLPILLGIALGACDEDATGPTRYELVALANNFESLGRARSGVGDIFGALASAQASVALRSGIRPARVNITVDGVTEEYFALEVEQAFGDDVTESPVLTLPIVSRTMVAWRGSPPQRVIAITVASDTGEFEPLGSLDQVTERPMSFAMFATGVMFERVGEPWFAVEGGARSTRQTIGESCPVPRLSSVSEMILPVLAPSSCNAAQFFTRFSMRTVEGLVPGDIAAPTRVIAMDGQDVAGVRLQYPPLPVMCPVCR